MRSRNVKQQISRSNLRWKKGINQGRRPEFTDIQITEDNASINKLHILFGSEILWIVHDKTNKYTKQHT